LWCLSRIVNRPSVKVLPTAAGSYDEGNHELYCSPNTFMEIRSRIMRWAGHMARMGERIFAYRVLIRKPE
jgi:hypothetical protein